MTWKPENDGGHALLYDCAVIGAGPAGLTAALYLTRFRRSVIVFDGGSSRAQWIPESHNCPGFPGGISGHRLLELLRHQLSGYAAHICAKRIKSLKRQQRGSLLVDADGGAVAARTVLLATGIMDTLPGVDWVEAAIGVGALRLCPVYDGFETRDQRIAISHTEYFPGTRPYPEPTLSAQGRLPANKFAYHIVLRTRQSGVLACFHENAGAGRLCQPRSMSYDNVSPPTLRGAHAIRHMGRQGAPV